MRHFWQGFDCSRESSPIRFKKHVIILVWSSCYGDQKYPEVFKRTVFKYPSVAVKVIDVKDDFLKSLKHRVMFLPTALLLKDGREVDRVNLESEQSLLETLFRRAHV